MTRNRKAARSSGNTRKRRRILFFSSHSLLIALCLIAASAGTLLLSGLIPLSSAAMQEKGTGKEQISESAMEQIRALIEEKESRSPAQRKMDSQLLYAAKMQVGQRLASGVPALEVKLPMKDSNHVVVDITANIGGYVLEEIEAAGGEIMNVVPSYSSIRAQVPIDRLESIAGLRDVVFIQPMQDAMTSGVKPAPSPAARTLPPGFEARASNVRASLSSALSRMAKGPSVRPLVGSRNSEGDTTHRAAIARGTFGVDGSGIKIGVLSDGVTNRAASQAAGDLPAITVLPGQAGSGDEGTAMLEIIHDMAPGAQLFFATALNSITSFAQNIRDLRAAGCDIIVDDVFYFVETPFQDGQVGTTNTNGGVVIQAVNDVTADGALYFSSAGNSGNLNDGTSGVWEGDFVDGGTLALVPGGRVHDFGGGVVTNQETLGGRTNLYWSDPLGGSSNDYDLFVLNAAGTAVVIASTNIQNGTQDPYEDVGTRATGQRVVILQKTGAANRLLHLNTNRGRLAIATAGQTHGHNSAANAFGCAATPANLPFGAPPNPVGPFPGFFNSTNTVERFSSDGPRRIIYNANGSPITPGNVSSTGGLVRQKPDITAADGTLVTGAGGFSSPFYGTSAAAPHAAAIAGLLKSANPAFTPAQIRAALLSTAIDIEAPGVDRDSGAGIIMPFDALLALGVTGQANLNIGAVSATELGGDGNTFIEPGESASLDVELKNTGVLDATNITATLSTSTPGVIVLLPNTSAYPDIPALNGSAFNVTPFRFTLASDAACPLTIEFKLTLNYTGGVSPKVLTFSVQTGLPPLTVSSTLDTTPPAANPLFTAITGLQTPRLNRNGIVSTCAAPKAFPGVTGAGTRRFDAYSFATCPGSGTRCVTVTLTTTCIGANPALFVAAYLNTFDPNNQATGYLGDPGVSQIAGGPNTFSVNVPAGATLIVVVSEVNQNLGLGCNYSLNVSGLCLPCEVPNQLPVALCQNVTVPAGADCTANASIDNGSFDPDGGPVTVTQSPAGPYPLGTTNVVLTVTDGTGAITQCSATVTVVDNTAPTISGASASPSSLWPANHKMVDVAVNYATADNCTPASGITCALTVTSNEPDNGLGDGDTPNDIEVVDAHNVRLRAERSGTGGGRVYTITITCTDGAGNSSTRAVTVSVPHSKGR